MAKFFHRLPNGDFKIFDSEAEYLRELSDDKWPVKTMIFVGLLFIAGAIWTWKWDDPVGNFFLVGCGLWMIGFTILGAKTGGILSDIIFNIALIPIYIVLAAIFGYGDLLLKGIAWIRSLF